jgi:acetylglutamate kinase
VPGILTDPLQRDSLISSVTISQIDELIRRKVIAGGMIPKVQSATGALKKGVEKVHMIGGHIQHCLLLEIFTDAGIGTEIVH